MDLNNIGLDDLIAIDKKKEKQQRHNRFTEKRSHFHNKSKYHTNHKNHLKKQLRDMPTDRPHKKQYKKDQSDQNQKRQNSRKQQTVSDKRNRQSTKKDIDPNRAQHRSNGTHEHRSKQESRSRKQLSRHRRNHKEDYSKSSSTSTVGHRENKNKKDRHKFYKLIIKGFSTHHSSARILEMIRQREIWSIKTKIRPQLDKHGEERQSYIVYITFKKRDSADSFIRQYSKKKIDGNYLYFEYGSCSS